MALCMCRVDSCMGCIPLQRGAIIVGFIYMFGSMMETFKYMYGLVDFELKVRQCAEAEPMIPDMYSEDVKGPIYQALRDDLRFCPKGRMLALTRSAMVIPIFIFFIYFILTALMIHGARQDRPRLIAPWLWWQLSLFVVTILGIIGLQSLEDFLYKMSVLLVAVYLFMVVNSYYLELLRRERNPSRVTVIAMAHPRSEMMVSLPSPLKDDSPPPYHACYVPNESPYPPPYHAASPGYPTMPPPYQSSDPLMASCSGTTQAESQTPPTPVAPTTVTVNPTPASPSPVTPNPPTPITPEATQAPQEEEPKCEESRVTPETVGERAPLVVKLPTSQSN